MKAARRLGQWRCTLTACLLMATLGWSASYQPGQAQAEAPYYAGKTIRLVNNFTVAGSSDVWARFHARHIGRFIPGNPTVIVENRPGAGGISGFQWLATAAAPDGLTVGILGGTLPRKEAQGEFPPNSASVLDTIIIAGASDADVYFGPKRVFPNGGRDIVKPSKTPIFHALIGDDDGIRDQAAFHLFGLLPDKQYKLVRGYRGGSDVYIAMQRGEVDLYATRAMGYNQTPAKEVEAGNWVAMWQGGTLSLSGDIVRDSAVPDIPTFHEVYRAVFGKNPQGPEAEYLEWQIAASAVTRIIVVPQKTPDHLVQVLRTAWEKMSVDPDFLADQEKVFGSRADNTSSSAETIAAIKKVFAVSDDVRNYIKKVSAEAGGKK